MPTVEPVDGGRFARITEREAPEAETPLPLIFDPAAVAALEAKGDGCYALHLVGGQTLQLRPPVSGAVLKKLGLAAAATRAEKQRPAKDPLKAKKPRAPRRRPAPEVKQAGRPKGLLPAIAALWS